MAKVRIAVAGAGGKMGKRILTLAQSDSEFQVRGALEKEGSDVLGTDVGLLLGRDLLGIQVVSDFEEACGSSQVLIDFTHPGATEEHIQGALKVGIGLVIGTTGLSERTHALLKEASRKIPILQSPNMSTGVNLLFELVQRVSQALDEGYDIEITESHHRMKKDSPSGTALEIARLIAETKGWSLGKALVYGRHGQNTEKKKGTIGIHSLRGGDVVGEHIVSFLGDGEILELVHRATSRDAFARGALVAAKFIAGKKRGLYNMGDVLRP